MKRLQNTIALIALILLVKQSYSQDKSVLEKKAMILIDHLRKSYTIPLDAKDTLIDLNGDQYKDALFEYYGMTGSGEKNRIAVYLYDKTAGKFKRCDMLCNLPNPTFYFDKKIVTGYYVANGGGSAAKFKWRGSKLDSLESIDVDIQQKGDKTSFIVTSFDFATKKTNTQIFDMMTLPKEYNYGRYVPIIKREYQ